MKKTIVGIFILLAAVYTPYTIPAVLATADPPAPTCAPPTCKDCILTSLEADCRQQALFHSSGYDTGKPTSTIPGRIGVLITVVTSVTGIAFTAIVVFSGIQWMLAEKKKKWSKSKDADHPRDYRTPHCFESWSCGEFCPARIDNADREKSDDTDKTLP